MGIKNTHLIWIGSEHYRTIEDWVEEANSMGVSKRLPGAGMAKGLMEPGTVVFVAHDEGQTNACPECEGEIENPEVRKIQSAIVRLDDEIEALEEEQDLEDGEAIDPMLPRKISRRRAKRDGLMSELNRLPWTVLDGTGGSVVVDGERWDYRRYEYWLHQPARWNPEGRDVEKDMCERCGGKGRLPEGKVFGMFMPTAFEYMVPDDGLPEKAPDAEAFKYVEPSVRKAEGRRKCGRRKEGGTYVVASTEGDAERAKKRLAEMVEKGQIDDLECEITGDFVRFLEPVAIHEKRFRGLKSGWLPPVEASDEAEMALEGDDD